MLGGHQADEGHHLRRCLEAAEVADLGDERERERVQGVDATQSAQPRQQLAPRLLLGGLADYALSARSERRPNRPLAGRNRK
jgi:hypothetical protein